MTDPEIESFEAHKKQKQQKILTSHAAQLAEFFDSVQIICTVHDPQDGTLLHAHGEGNYYARLASCAEFLRLEKK